MHRLIEPGWFKAAADFVASRLHRRGIRLTIGGEPSYVPTDPRGPEWNYAALGPTKLIYARALADTLIERALPGAIAFFSPGKLYPGEPNPRWAVHLISNQDGTPICGKPGNARPSSKRASLRRLRRDLLTRLKIRGRWQPATDPANANAEIWVLPLDHTGKRWCTERWPAPHGRLVLLDAEGPAGLRLPLFSLPAGKLKRALVLESNADGLHLFFPPLLQAPFVRLVALVGRALKSAGITRCFYQGYIPADDDRSWSILSLTADPGVLEVNLPPCAHLGQYAQWLEQLESCAARVGLRSFKESVPREIGGTGGGNHLLFGGPSLEENAFFRNPQWITSILRYWHHHPALSYLFTGAYVGAASQAPRADESVGELDDLEVAYQFLESLEPGQDHRAVISDTLRHLHIDRSGNTHRSEISFDKFWNGLWPGGSRGLIEFRAIETLPHASWMSAVALLWSALLAFLFDKPCLRPLRAFGDRLHDFYFRPAQLWADLVIVLRDLRSNGFLLDEKLFRQIWEFRFPEMLAFSRSGARLTVRKALEAWPLLCESPLEGGNTSRFVDTSMERIELTANRKFAGHHRVFIQGRELTLHNHPGTGLAAAVRYRRTALQPSLHPGLSPNMPLHLTITDRQRRSPEQFILHPDQRRFEPTRDCCVALRGPPCRPLRPGLLTCDLRLT